MTEKSENTQAPGVEARDHNGKPITICRMVIYRSKTGYDAPAVITATVDTLIRENVEAGFIPDLDTKASVHLSVFTPGSPGKGATPPEGAQVPANGVYQEWNVPLCGSEPGAAWLGDEPAPGTWRWPERV